MGAHIKVSAQPRRGHTLMELVTAMVASAMLLAGLGSVMLIARRITYTPMTATQRIDAAKLVNELLSDLRCATVIVEQSPVVLDFVVADRNADGVAERIRYQWSGIAGAPLTRSMGGAAPVTVLDSVQEFFVLPTTLAKTETLKTSVKSSEALFASNATVQSGSNLEITSTVFEAQQINPATFSAASPAGSTSWNANRVDFYGRQRDFINLFVQLRRSGDPNNGPTSNVLGQVIVPGNSITSGFGWNTATFASPVTGLPLHRRFNLVFAGASGGEAVRLQVTDGAGGSGVLESTDSGAKWSLLSNRQMYYRLYGTYNSPGPNYNITRNYVKQLRIQLRAGSQSAARVDASVALDNMPELLSNYWRLDFDNNPTTTDADASGAVDWATTGGGSFSTGSLAGGIWTASGGLESRPLNDFIKVTTVEVSCRNTSVGGNGAVVRINTDRQSSLHAPIFTYLQLQSDGTQTLTLYGKNTGGNVQLFSRSRLPNDFIRIRFTIDPTNNIVNLLINGEDQGTYTYPTLAPTQSDGFLTLYADTSAAQFDYAEVRVATP